MSKYSVVMRLTEEEWDGIAKLLRYRSDVCKNEGACNSDNPKETLRWADIYGKIAHKIERSIKRRKDKAGSQSSPVTA